MWVRFLAALGVGGWCFFILFASLGMVVDRGLADSPWAWMGVLGIGVLVPVVLLMQVNRAIASYEDRTPATSRARSGERELLEAVRDRGEITPATAAMRTSLTVDEAATMLETLAGKGHLRAVSRDGMLAYSLFERDRLDGPAGDPAAEGYSPEGSALPPSEGSPAERSGLAVEPTTEPLAEPLSEREREVLALLATGRTNREIAGDLFVTVGTVKSHTSNIYAKLGSRNRAEAIGRARELNLLK